MSYGLNGDSKQIIFALKSERDRLKERVAVLEMLVQSTSDDRDGYAERAAELERQIAKVQTRVNELERDANRRFAEEYGAAAGAARMTIADVQELLAEVTGTDGDTK